MLDDKDNFNQIIFFNSYDLSWIYESFKGIDENYINNPMFENFALKVADNKVEIKDIQEIKKLLELKKTELSNSKNKPNINIALDAIYDKEKNPKPIFKNIRIFSIFDLSINELNAYLDEIALNFNEKHKDEFLKKAKLSVLEHIQQIEKGYILNDKLNINHRLYFTLYNAFKELELTNVIEYPITLSYYLLLFVKEYINYYKIDFEKNITELKNKKIINIINLNNWLEYNEFILLNLLTNIIVSMIFGKEEKEWNNLYMLLKFTYYDYEELLKINQYMNIEKSD